jgi:hypothetical protein
MLAVVVPMVGCLALVGYGMATMPDIPPHATAAAVEQRHGRDLELLREWQRQGRAGPPPAQLSAAVLAVEEDGHERLGRLPISGRSFATVNGAGIGHLNTASGMVPAVVYILPNKPPVVRVFFTDPAPAAAPKPAAGPTAVER